MCAEQTEEVIKIHGDRVEEQTEEALVALTVLKALQCPLLFKKYVTGHASTSTSQLDSSCM